MPQARPASGQGRLIFAMDATASREPTWDRACHIQGEMFETTAGLGGLAIQLVFYRGFGEGKGIWGTWEIRWEARGGFHIWPRGYAVRNEEALSAEEEIPVLAFEI